MCRAQRQPIGLVHVHTHEPSCTEMFRINKKTSTTKTQFEKVGNDYFFSNIVAVDS